MQLQGWLHQHSFSLSTSNRCISSEIASAKLKDPPNRRSVSSASMGKYSLAKTHALYRVPYGLSCSIPILLLAFQAHATANAPITGNAQARPRPLHGHLPLQRPGVSCRPASDIASIMALCGLARAAGLPSHGINKRTLRDGTLIYNVQNILTQTAGAKRKAQRQDGNQILQYGHARINTR